jgi:hypothetical protein
MWEQQRMRRFEIEDMTLDKDPRRLEADIMVEMRNRTTSQPTRM